MCSRQIQQLCVCFIAQFEWSYNCFISFRCNRLTLYISSLFLLYIPFLEFNLKYPIEIELTSPNTVKERNKKRMSFSFIESFSTRHNGGNFVTSTRLFRNSPSLIYCQMLIVFNILFSIGLTFSSYVELICSSSHLMHLPSFFIIGLTLPNRRIVDSVGLLPPTNLTSLVQF